MPILVQSALEKNICGSCTMQLPHMQTHVSPSKQSRPESKLHKIWHLAIRALPRNQLSERNAYSNFMLFSIYCTAEPRKCVNLLYYPHILVGVFLWCEPIVCHTVFMFEVRYYIWLFMLVSQISLRNGAKADSKIMTSTWVATCRKATLRGKAVTFGDALQRLAL